MIKRNNAIIYIAQQRIAYDVILPIQNSCDLSMKKGN